MPFVTCPNCDHEHKAPRELIGLLVDCPKCGEAIQVSDADEPPRAFSTHRRKRKRSAWLFPPWATVLTASIVLLGGIGLCVVLLRDSGAKAKRADAQDYDTYTAKLKKSVPLDVDAFKKTGMRAEQYDKDELNLFRVLVLKVEPVYLTDRVTGETQKYTRARLVRNNPPPARFNSHGGLASMPEPFEWVKVEMLP